MGKAAMATTNPERRLRLALRGEGFRHGEVPVSIVAGKLLALQNLLFHAAATVAPERTARRGPWQNRYRDGVELSFLGTHHSDLAFEVEMPRPSPTLAFAEDIGQRALDLVCEIGRAIQTGPSRLEQMKLRPEDRAYLLRAFEGLLPRTLDDYEVE